MEIEKPDTWSPLGGSACPFEGQLTAQEGSFFLDKGHLKVCTAIQNTQVTDSNCNGRPHKYQLGRVKRIWYLSPMRAAKVQASLRIRAVSPEPPLLADTSSESRGTFRQKARSLAPLNDWACAVKICHDGMLEDTNSLDAVQLKLEEYATFI